MGSDSTGASALAWHPGGHLLATGHADGGVRIWQAPHGRLRRALGGGAPSVRAFAPSSAGAALAIVMDEALHLIDMASGRPRLGIHAAARITSLAWSADGALLAVEGLRVGGDGAVRLWSGATGELLTVLRTGAAVRFLAWELGSQDRRLLAVGFWEHPPQLWDVRPRRPAPRRGGPRCR